MHIKKMVVNEMGVRLDVLYDEVAYFKTLIKPTATGHIHTTIGQLQERIEMLERKLWTEKNSGLMND